ncbi:hypothetical protein SAMN04487785_103279 [Dyella jiangningensis]|uniref:esterase/lipase family protein n=1 Tax=Dyella sp. AtDHG13 TaxID=1938897 RepID=UPI00088D4AC2|nr:hypothetical protein [Dyella sp. AtDHG13]PXV61561.1 hypothetical protein BDW41_101304 [Dyella sp. AtDHG13]SDJ71417.1 hypothetical protein SAMN04487785_103279 [Dyella jiangningensis]
MSTPPDQLNAQPRVAPYHFDEFGRQVHAWNLTPSHITEPVILPLGPPHVLPVIFVPGIMGSNLRSYINGQSGDPVWRLDSKPGLGKKWIGRSAGTRQVALHPDRVEVDNRGAVPTKAAGSVGFATYKGADGQTINIYTERGWGEIAAASYQDFLLWLEHTLNGQGWDPMTWSDYGLVDSVVGPAPVPGQKPAPYPPQLRMRVQGLPEGSAERNLEELPLVFRDLQKRAMYLMPVYACGYNWLDSNEKAAERLATRIDEIIRRYGSRCTQVVVVTHSMGGLVTRRCAMLPGMASKIAGVVHGVMPAVGAAVAYRRCKVGMADESSSFFGKMGALAIGNSGREVTAVFAQAPGALQLLPSGHYPAGWLRLCDEHGRPAMPPQPTADDPYTQIYLRRDRWWGLVREAWLAPEGGQAITWADYVTNAEWARKFHAIIRNAYHSTTYVYYGADDHQPSFANITWRMAEPAPPPPHTPLGPGNFNYPTYQPGRQAATRPSPERVQALGFHEVTDDGSNPVRLTAPGNGDTRQPWYVRCATQDSSGDGTVPRCSGRAPLATDNRGHVREQFRLTGFDHEGSYQNDGARRVTLYAITRIAGAALVPCSATDAAKVPA